MMFHFCAQTDSGRIRGNNEDSVAFDEKARVAVLADGMGGYNAGEVASGMATAFIQSELSRWLTEAGQMAQAKDVRRAMELCVDSANRLILNSAHANSAYTGMGTTLVVGVFQENRLLLGHIGDSRCYRLRAGILSQITKDHSLLQEKIDAGLISMEQAANSSIKNLLTRALGVEEIVILDVHEHAVESGDLYLMCSDGLSDMVVDELIAKIASEDTGLDHKAKLLISVANENGGKDNISVLMVAVSETEKGADHAEDDRFDQ